jgi:hypothetical protein
VAQHSLNIEEGGRTTASVENVLKRLGLAPASREEYRNWIYRRQQAVTKSGNDTEVAC